MTAPKIFLIMMEFSDGTSPMVVAYAHNHEEAHAWANRTLGVGSLNAWHRGRRYYIDEMVEHVSVVV